LQAVIRKAVPYIEMEEFHPDNVAKVSKACKSICQWVRAMYVYHNVALQVEPKRAALSAAQAELDETNRQLASAQAQLQAVQDKIASLEAQFKHATEKKAALAKQVEDCQSKLHRADKLIGGLGEEKVIPDPYFTPCYMKEAEQAGKLLEFGNAACRFAGKRLWTL
jgi:dynein heavy chain, axonemal